MLGNGTMPAIDHHTQSAGPMITGPTITGPMITGPMITGPAPGDDPRLDRLTRNAHDDQWRPDTAIDWDRPVVRPRILSGRFYGALVSQLYHGEIATMAVCRNLLKRIPDRPARAFLATQYADEARHADVYERYLGRLGHKAAMDDGLLIALEGGLSWRGGINGLVVAYQILLESEALGIQQLLAERLPCPLFRQINSRIARDEARHIAFGKIYLNHRLTALPQDERFAIYRWVKALWRDCARATEGRYGRLGRRALGLRELTLDARWCARREMLRGIGLIAPGETPPD